MFTRKCGQKGQGDDGSGREQPRARGGGGHEEQYTVAAARPWAEAGVKQSADTVDNRRIPPAMWVGRGSYAKYFLISQ